MSSSGRIIEAFEVIVASVIQDENFDELLTEGNDVALLAERVRHPYTTFLTHIMYIFTSLAIHICRLIKRIWEEHLELVMVSVHMYCIAPIKCLLPCNYLPKNFVA